MARVSTEIKSKVTSTANTTTHSGSFPLTTEESNLLSSCENVIYKQMRSVWEVARALTTIRDMKLYRAEFATFEEYCRTKWGFTRQYAYLMIDALAVHQNLSTIVDIPPPTTEGQIRDLTGLPAEEQKAVWISVHSGPEKGTVTGKMVKDAARELKQKKKEPREDVYWQSWIKPLLRKLSVASQTGDLVGVVSLIQKLYLHAETGVLKIGKETLQGE